VVLTGLALFGAVLGLGADQPWPSRLLTLGTSATALLALGLLRQQRAVGMATAGASVCVTVTFVASALLTEGATAFVDPWCVVPSLLALVLVGPRAGWATALAVMVASVVGLWAQRAGLLHPPQAHGTPEWLWFGSMLAALPLVQGVVSVWLLTVQQASREQEQAEARKREEHQQRLVLNLVHEVNNPLTVATVNSGWLAKDLESSSLLSRERREALRETEVSLEELRDFMDDLRALVGDVWEQDSEVALDVAVVEAARAEQALLERCPHTLHVPEGLDWKGPRHGLVRLVRQLLRNAALSGLGSPPHVDVTVTTEPGAWVLQVADTGRGLTEDQLQHSFDPFAARNETSRGRGLGLPLARALTHQLGGTLTLTPRTGGGTVATVRLPRLR
jgi:signal transduction histidine kinase